MMRGIHGEMQSRTMTETFSATFGRALFRLKTRCVTGSTGPRRSMHLNPIRYGLFNMSGNVWEWCADRFRIRSVRKTARVRTKQAAANREHVLKGGSFLCHRSYCWRYRIAARTGRARDDSTCNAGFRLAFDA